MKRKWLLVLLSVLIIVAVFTMYRLNMTNANLDSLSGEELQDAISSKKQLTVEELNSLQQRGEWGAVEQVLRANKVQPTPELFSQAIQQGTPEVVTAYLQTDIDPFVEVNGEAVLATLYGENADRGKWEIVHQELKDERLLPIAANALDMKAVQSLLGNGVAIPSADEETILFQAVRHNQVPLIELLIENGAVWTNEHEQLAQDFRSDLVIDWMNQN